MTDKEDMKWIAECLKEGPQSKLEKTLLEEYLRKQGYSLADLKTLPEEKAKALMVEACKYASLKLAQVESKAGFREKIRGHP
jgi:hypothetical protein